MKPTIVLLTLGSVLLLGGFIHAGPPAKDKVIVEPESADKREFTIGMPAWIAGVRGDTGINGSSAHANTGFGEVVNKLDLAARFGPRRAKGSLASSPSSPT